MACSFFRTKAVGDLFDTLAKLLQTCSPAAAPVEAQL